MPILQLTIQTDMTEEQLKQSIQGEILAIEEKETTFPLMLWFEGEPVDELDVVAMTLEEARQEALETFKRWGAPYHITMTNGDEYELQAHDITLGMVQLDE